jgi:hypothetical protein
MRKLGAGNPMEVALRVSGRRATVQTVELPGYTVVFGFAGGSE